MFASSSTFSRQLDAKCWDPLIDGKAKHSPTNDWDTNAVWVGARRAVTVTQERHTEPQDKTLPSVSFLFAGEKVCTGQIAARGPARVTLYYEHMHMHIML